MNATAAHAAIRGARPRPFAFAFAMRRGRDGLYGVHRGAIVCVTAASIALGVMTHPVLGVIAIGLAFGLLQRLATQQNAPLVAILASAEVRWRARSSLSGYANPRKAFNDPRMRLGMLCQLATHFAAIVPDTQERSGKVTVRIDRVNNPEREAAAYLLFAALLSSARGARIAKDGIALTLTCESAGLKALPGADRALSDLFGVTTLPCMAAHARFLLNKAREVQYMLAAVTGGFPSSLEVPIEDSPYFLRIGANPRPIAYTTDRQGKDGTPITYRDAGELRRAWDERLSAESRSELSEFFELHAAQARLGGRSRPPDRA